MNANPSSSSGHTTATLTSCTFNHVDGIQLNNPSNTNNYVYGNWNQITNNTSLALPLVETNYGDFRRVIHGDVIALQNIRREDLSLYEWNVRFDGRIRIFGRLKALVTTQTIELFPYKDHKFTLVKYEGADAEKIWKRDFRTFSKTREPGLPQLFAINLSKIPMLVFHHTEHTPIIGMQMEKLEKVLWSLSLNFDILIKKDTHPYGYLSLVIGDNLPDGMREPVERLNLSRSRLRNNTSAKEWDQVLQQFLHFLHLFGLEVSSEVDWVCRRLVKVKDSGTIEELDDDDGLSNISSFCNTTQPLHPISSLVTVDCHPSSSTTQASHLVCSSPRSPTFVQDGNTRKRKRNASDSTAKPAPFAIIRANKRFKPASLKKQRLLENARKRPGLRRIKLNRQ